MRIDILKMYRKLAELARKDYGSCRYVYKLTGPNRLESWFLLTTRFKDNRFDAPFQNRASPVSFSFYLQRMIVWFKIADRILVRGSAIKKF